MPIFSSLYGTRLDRELGSADSTVLFTTARRKAAINEAALEFADLTECLLRRSSVTLVQDVGEYALSSSSVLPDGDFLRLAKEPPQLRVTDSNGLVTITAGDAFARREVEYLHRFEPGWQVSTVSTGVLQVPTLFYERAENGVRALGVAPVPGVPSSVSMALLVPYVAQPAALTSDTQEPFSVGGVIRTDLRPYHQALVHYAAHQLEKLRRDDEASQLQLQKFLGYVQRWLAQARVKGGRALTSARSYFAPRRTATAGDPRR